MTKSHENKKKGGNRLFLLGALGVALAFPFYRTHIAENPLSFVIPNFLLFTPYRDLTRSYWEKATLVDRNVKRTPLQIPVIQAADYSFESMRVATENFRYPAVVRGLFKDAPGVSKWAQPEYLKSKLGDFVVPVVRKAQYGTLQNDRGLAPFSESVTDILTNEKSMQYLFFPVESRDNFNHSDSAKTLELKKATNQLVYEDLELGRIWPGFGTKAHSTYFGAQIIIGRGTNDSDATTGTGWHCAAGNNWFIQVVGTKRWYFVDPKHSAVMSPLRGGKVNMMTGNRQMAAIHDNIPLRFTDVYAGDLLYNPDWEWHTIKNYEGVSIGCPIRELNVTLSLRNNLQYTSIVLLNKLMEKFGVDIGGYPPAY